MSETVMRVPLSELTTFRITCKKCGKGVVEVTLERLNLALDSQARCRFCDQKLFVSGNPLGALQGALEELHRQEDAGVLHVEIDLKEDSR